jgi:hypothetical protein
MTKRAEKELPQTRTQKRGCRAAVPPPPQPTKQNLKKIANFVDTMASKCLRDFIIQPKSYNEID